MVSIQDYAVLSAAVYVKCRGQVLHYDISLRKTANNISHPTARRCPSISDLHHSLHGDGRGYWLADKVGFEKRSNHKLLPAQRLDDFQNYTGIVDGGANGKREGQVYIRSMTHHLDSFFLIQLQSKSSCSNCFSNPIQFPPASLAIKQKRPGLFSRREGRNEYGRR